MIDHLKSLALGVVVGIAAFLLAEKLQPPPDMHGPVHVIPLHNKADLYAVVFRGKIYFLTEVPIYLDKKEKVGK